MIGRVLDTSGRTFTISTPPHGGREISVKGFLPSKGDSIIWYPETETFAFYPGEDFKTVEHLLSRCGSTEILSQLRHIHLEKLANYIDLLCERDPGSLGDLRYWVDEIRERWLSLRCYRWFKVLGLSPHDLVSIRHHEKFLYRLFYKLITKPHLMYELPSVLLKKISSLYQCEISEKHWQASNIARHIASKKTSVGIPTEEVIRLVDDASVIEILKGEFKMKISYKTLYLPERFEAESMAAYHLKRFSDGDPLLQKDEIVQFSPRLSVEQCAAVRGTLTQPISLITGGAGTGKTTVIKEIVRLSLERGKRVYLTSFTGKAVSRIKEVVSLPEESSLRMSTMHLAIAKRETTDFSLVIIDEVSMVTSGLFNKWCDTFGTDYQIIFVGDVNQLPPIEYGRLAEGILKSKKIKTFTLSTNHRSASLIHENASRLISGDKNLVYGPEFAAIKDGSLEILRQILTALKDRGVSPYRISIITPYNVFVHIINKLCQGVFLNKTFAIHKKTPQGTVSFRKGDKVRHLKNDYSVMNIRGIKKVLHNGDEGVVTAIWKDCLQVLFKGEDEKFIIRNLDNISLNYCTTIHQSQGSEWEDVILYVPSGENSSFLDRRLMYTAITRAKRTLTVVGDISTFEKSCFRPGIEIVDNLSKAIIREFSHGV